MKNIKRPPWVYNYNGPIWKHHNLRVRVAYGKNIQNYHRGYSSQMIVYRCYLMAISMAIIYQLFRQLINLHATYSHFYWYQHIYSVASGTYLKYIAWYTDCDTPTCDVNLIDASRNGYMKKLHMNQWHNVTMIIDTYSNWCIVKFYFVTI